MEVTIIIIHPMFILVAKMETIEDIIAGHFFVFSKPSGDTIAGVEIDCFWSDISTWEYDLRKNLSPVINREDVIVECRITGPRYTKATGTQRRIKEIFCNILGINDR